MKASTKKRSSSIGNGSRSSARDLLHNIGEESSVASSNNNSTTAFNALFSSPSGMGGANSAAAALPPHQRKFTPHSYFSNTLRDIVADGEAVAVIIPKPSTELALRKRMFKIYQDDSIRSLKEYEMRLREVVNAETTHFDIRMNGSTVAFKSTGAADTSSSGSGGVVVRKRYLYLRSEVEQGKQPVGIPLNQQLIDNLYRPVSGSTFHAVASTNSIVPKSLRPSPPGTPAINKQASARPPPPHPHPHS